MSRLAALLLLATPLALSAAALPAAGQRSEIAVDVGLLSGGVSYARRLGAGPVTAGVGAWGAWEPGSTFERNVWEPLALVAFTRYRPATWVHADLGALAGRYLWTDDCGECAGTLLGVRAAALVGYRWLFVGPDLLLARASDERHGAGTGVIWGVHGRLTIDWGR